MLKRNLQIIWLTREAKFEKIISESKFLEL